MFETTVFDCDIIGLPQIKKRAGKMTSVSSLREIQFDVQRVYYLYDIPAGESRGGHAHKQLQQLIVAASGSFDVLLDDGKVTRNINLNHPSYGLCIKPGIWRELINFSSGAIVIALASEPYFEEDYIRDYREFIKYK